MNLERLLLTECNSREQILQIRAYLFKLVEQLENTISNIEGELKRLGEIVEQKGEK